MRDVALLAGVGIKTVSRVMNDEPNVAPETVERVRAASRTLDYRLHVQAGNLRRSDGRTRTVGLLVSSVDNPFAGAVHRAIEDVARAEGVMLFASSLDDDPQRERDAVEAFLQRRVDGLILTTATPDQSYLTNDLRRGTPAVFVDREAVGLVADSIVSDNRAGAERGTTHLLARGHRRIAYLGDRHEISTARERLRGFRDAVEKSQVPEEETRIVEDLADETRAHRALLDLLDAPDPPTAVFSAQNLITLGAIRALRERGCEHDTALVGFDDFSLADLVVPATTVVAQHPDDIGRIAAERLFARISGDESPPRRIVVETTLIPRGSGEILPGRDAV